MANLNVILVNKLVNISGIIWIIYYNYMNYMKIILLNNIEKKIIYDIKQICYLKRK